MATKYDTSYYDDSIRKYRNQATNLANQQIAESQANTDAQLRQAYIANMQQRQNLNNQLANAGIRGGTTESANLNLANQYNTQAGSLRAAQAANVKSINQDLANNIFNYTQAVDDNRQQYIQSREAEARAIAQQKAAEKRQEQAQIRAENREVARQKEAEKKADTQAKWQAKYGKYWSISKLNKARKKAKTQAEINAIDTRIGYIREYKRQLKDSKK